MLSGLEGSRGALYEIGVSDDGTFVGLTEDEMEESLVNLRAMAASLGCKVEVTKMVMVGNCEWQNNGSDDGTAAQRVKMKLESAQADTLRHRAQLWVAEALVIPDLSQRTEGDEGSFVDGPASATDSPRVDALPTSRPATSAGADVSTEQLRITLTGSTTSGKSSLLGTLSSATLDDGRGRSRVHLFRHAHERNSGITSSVTQELFGYRTGADGTVTVVNYAMPDITTWNDIHGATGQGRLTFVSDSAGHFRYRRTTVRGLVGWSPHWTLLCVSSEDRGIDTSEGGGPGDGQGVDTSKAHLDLCLKLEVPLVIVMTKFDLANTKVRQVLNKMLSAIKATGRVPTLLPPEQAKNIASASLGSITAADVAAIRNAVDMMDGADLARVVPIVMTSSLKGTGIRQLHALLNALPIPSRPTARDYLSDTLNPEQPESLFHVEDVFGLPASYSMQTSNGTQLEEGLVVAGHLRFGSMSIGQEIVVGPFPSENDDQPPNSRSGGRTPPIRRMHESEAYGSFGLSQSQPSTADMASMANRQRSAAVTPGEWHNAVVVSIRNLRLPVHTLLPGQVGTIGLVFDIPELELSNGPFERPPPELPRMRKGMVLARPNQHMLATGHTLQAASGLTASFEDGDVNSVSLGSLVVIYIASIRASARVVRMTPHIPILEPLAGNNDDDVFGFDDGREMEREDDPAVFGHYGTTDVTFELMTNREWIELGSKILMMPGGGITMSLGSSKRPHVRGEKSMPGLDGFVGKVIEVVD